LYKSKKKSRGNPILKLNLVFLLYLLNNSGKLNDYWRKKFGRIPKKDTVATLQTDFLSNTVIASEAKQSSSYQEIASSLRSSQ